MGLFSGLIVSPCVGPVIAGVKVDDAGLSRYGIADVTPVEGNVYKINKIIEKPGKDKAPSNLATHGNYLLTPDIFAILQNLPAGKNGEIWLAEAIDKLIASRNVYAVELKNAKYYDCGNKLEYLKAVVEFGLEHEDLREGFGEYLKGLNPKIQTPNPKQISNSNV